MPWMLDLYGSKEHSKDNELKINAEEIALMQLFCIF